MEWWLYFPFINAHTHCQVRVDISARNPGNIHAALTENRKVLYELILEPLREEQYYEVSILSYLWSFLLVLQNVIDVFDTILQIREPFSIWSVVKSPMGLMLGFTLLVIFVMPKLMDSIGKILVSVYLSIHHVQFEQHIYRK